MCVKLSFIGINGVRQVKRGVDLVNMGYQKGNKAVMKKEKGFFAFIVQLALFC